MILNRIQIEGYKTLRNAVELKDLGVGIHLIHGPNETGKSTLMSAVARALFDRYNTQDQEIRALRPWGTELAPRVTLEFETGGKRYKLDKKFLDEEGSSLSEWNGSKFERVADSVKSDDRVRSFLLGTASKSGAAGLSNWGLARLLWMTQLPSRMSAPSLDEPLRQHLLGVLGSAVLSGKEQRLLTQLDKSYDVFYTAAKQSEKKGSPLQEARDRLAKAEETLIYWKGKWDEVSRLNELSLDAQDKLAKTETERLKIDGEMAALRARAEEELKLENLLRVKEQELLVVQGRWKVLVSSGSEIQALERLIQQHQQSLVTVEPEIRAQEAKLAVLESRLKESQFIVQMASLKASECSREMGTAAVASSAKRLWSQAQELESHRAQAAELQRKRDSLRAEYAAKKRPKNSDLEEARSLHSEVLALRARITRLGIEVRVLPERAESQVQWVNSEGIALNGQGETVFRDPDQGELVIPGFGRIQICSGAEDSKRVKAELFEREARLHAKLLVFGCSQFDELAQARTLAQELETSGSTTTAALQAALGTRFRSVAEMASELDKIRANLKLQMEQAGLSESSFSENGADSDLREIQARSDAAIRSRDLALKDYAAMESELRLLQKKISESRRIDESARQGLELLGAQLHSKQTSLGGPEALARETHETVHLKNALESERAILAAKLPPTDQRASIRVAFLSRAREETARSEQVAQRELDQANALLLNAQGEGYYTKLAAAEEERAMATELLAQRLTQANGTKVLRTLAHIKRERMNSGLLAPVEAKVISLFNHLRGGGDSPDFCSRLVFGDDLHEIRVRIGEGTSTESQLHAGIDSLSLGTQEQVMLALRLAFGQLLSERGEKPEPQLVVLDDPLVNADAARQERARELLKQASSRLQILILTARPEDYRALNPKEYDLSALKA